MALGRSGRGKGGSLVLLGIVFMVFVILLAILYGIYYYNVSSGKKQGHRTMTTTTTRTIGWSAKYFYIHIVADWYIDDGEITVLELIGRDSPIPSSIPLSIGGTSDYMKIYVYDGDSLIAYKEELLYSGDVEKFVDVTGLKGHYITVKIQLVNVDVGMYGIPDETVVDEREGTFYVG